MKEKRKKRSQFYYISPVANFASKGLDASQLIPIKPSMIVWWNCFRFIPCAAYRPKSFKTSIVS
jgi:hypothetical protein